VRPNALAVFRLTTSWNFVELLDRQIGRLLALEDPARVDTNQTQFTVAEDAGKVDPGFQTIGNPMNVG
jgi:hypothetical protein